MPEPGRRVDLVTDIEQLRKKSEAVYPEEDIQGIVADLFAMMGKSQNCAGLSAIQLGCAKQIFIMVQEKPFPPICVVNPLILKRKGVQTREESCLSLPGVFVEVTRSEQIKLVGYNQYMKPIKLKLKGLMARIALHEVDHLEGKLIIDYKEENHEPI